MGYGWTEHDRMINVSGRNSGLLCWGGEFPYWYCYHASAFRKVNPLYIWWFYVPHHIGLFNSSMDCKEDKNETDTIKSNTSRRMECQGKESQTLCESMEPNADADLLMKTNERIPENETKMFESSTLTTKKNHAYTVWLLIYFYLPSRLHGLL